MRKRERSARDGPSNIDILLLGLLLAGGAERYVDIEEVAYTCYRIAPTQFKWRLYDYPSLEAVQRAVGDIVKRFGESLIRKPKKSSTERMLTASGIERATRVAEEIVGKKLRNPKDVVTAFGSLENQPDAKRPSVRTSDSRPAQRLLRDIRKHRVFQRWLNGTPASSAAPWEIADLLNCLPDSPPEIWEDRIERALAQAKWWQDEDVLEFISDLRSAFVEGRLTGVS